MNLYESLNLLEQTPGSSDKEILLIQIVKRFTAAEPFFRFTFNDMVFGVKEQTFKNAFPQYKNTHNHISDWLPETHYIPMRDRDYRDYKVKDLIQFINRVILNTSGSEMQVVIQNFFDQCEPIKKKWFCRAILKDLRCGVQVKTINKVFKSLGLKTIDKFSMQLCNKLDLFDAKDIKKIKFPCTMECKYDGIRIQANIYQMSYEDVDGCPLEKTVCALTSRRGNDKTEDFPEVVEQLKEAFVGETLVLDGEIIADSFQKLTKKDDTSRRKYIIFDLLNDEGLIYKNRWDNLRSLCSGLRITTYLKDTNIKYKYNSLFTAEHFNCNNITDAKEYYEYMNEKGEEGIIIKLDDKPYERGSRKNMFKCKKVYTSDLKCTGYKLGTGKRSGMVSTLCLLDASGTIKVDVGSGIDDYTSRELTDQLDPHEEVPPFVGQIVEIKYNEITSTGSIRFPRYVGFREDKDEADDLSNAEVRQ